MALVVFCLAINFPTTNGQFVYDDKSQIAGNHLIRQGGTVAQALASDVFAFKGEKGEAWSRYWRPAFVTWLIVNYRLFGLKPRGWHVSSILLHALVVLLAYGLLLRLPIEPLPAISIGLLFAVHPVHVESVAWISGITDVLMSAALLASLWIVIRMREKPAAFMSAAAYIAYLLALLSKETAIVFPGIVFVLVLCDKNAETATQPAWRNASRIALPFAALAAVYLVIRGVILGQFESPGHWLAESAATFFTAPSVLLFYLRQIFFPYWLGPSYPLRVIGVAEAGFSNFLVPCAVVLMAGPVLFRLARRTPSGYLGAALFFLPLLPVLRFGSFHPEQLVHDRYLYLPLLGMLIIVIGGLAAFLQDSLGFSAGRSQMTCLGLAILACLPLSLQTLRYNRVWMNETALWETAVQSDPGSAFNQTEYARVLKEAGRLPEARQALEKALAIRPVTLGYVQRAEIALLERRFPEAESDLLTVLRRYPDNFAAYERLAICYEQQRRFDEALDLLRTARNKIPYRRCALTDKLAVVLVQAGRREEALSELESARSLVAAERNDYCQMALFHLGQLYWENSRLREARNVWAEFLDLTATNPDPGIRAARSVAGNSW